MNCMKCGREIPEGQVFCPGCLEVMSTYPIAPGVHAHIPKRPVKAPEKKTKELSPAAQIAHLKKVIHRLLVAIAALLVTVGVLGVLLAQTLNEPQPQRPTGQNYTTAAR